MEHDAWLVSLTSVAAALLVPDLGDWALYHNCLNKEGDVRLPDRIITLTSRPRHMG